MNEDIEQMDLKSWYENHWQIITRDKKDVFGIIRGDATYLSTVQLPLYDDYKYETCIFTKDGSEVLKRYRTQEEAYSGHFRFVKKYKLDR